MPSLTILLKGNIDEYVLFDLLTITCIRRRENIVLYSVRLL
jgi:hypothetical protein